MRVSRHRLLKDPLVHFLAAGIALFVAASAVSPVEAPENEIVVDRSTLLSFIQYRSKAFDPEVASSFLEETATEKREQLVSDYVREEALYRESEKLGLDENDYVIRQRMVQKMEFLAEAGAGAGDPSPEEIADYFRNHQAEYASQPIATFTHIFVASKDRGMEAATAEAARLLEVVNTAGAGFDDAGRFGDRFLFHKNYVERTEDYVASQLGPEAIAAIFKADAPLAKWVGPYQSEFGAHLFYITARAPERQPPLEEIRDRVAADLTEARRQEAIDRQIDGIVASYKVRIVDDAAAR